MLENPTARATENPRLDVWMFPCCTVPTSGFHDNGAIALVSLIREETPSIEENHALFTGSNKQLASVVHRDVGTTMESCPCHRHQLVCMVSYLVYLQHTRLESNTLLVTSV